MSEEPAVGTPKQGPERRLRRGAIAIDVVLVAVLIGLLPETLDLTASARRFPLVTIIVLFGLLALDLLMELMPGARRRLSFLEADYVRATDDSLEVAELLEEQEAQEQAEAQQTRFRLFTPWTATLALVAAGLLMYFVGYLVATPIFLALFFLWARSSIKVGIAMTVILSVFNYLVFYEFLGMR